MMFHLRWTAAVITGWSVLCLCPATLAQLTGPSDPKPPAVREGYTGQAMREIYRQDIGTGFTSESLNSIALQNARARVGYVGQSSAGSGSRIDLGLTTSRSGKPFSSVSASPTVSPYLNLFREDFDGSSDFNYQTLVRPQLQQQQYNQQFERQNTELSRRVQAISARSAFEPAGSKSQFPTGHQTVFMYYGRYYPSAAARQRRR